VATLLEQQRLRLDLGLAAGDTTTMPDAEVDAIYVEAAETYTDASSIVAATRVIAIQRLLASSAKMTSYTANNSSEDASDVFKHLMQLLGYWRGVLAAAIADDELANRPSAARFGRTTRRPARIKEHPGF
jgi:hypothetical protein